MGPFKFQVGSVIAAAAWLLCAPVHGAAAMIGVAAPSGPALAGAEAAESLRQSVAPGARRSGDETMSCTQIFAEMKQQPLQSPSPELRAEGAATAQGVSEATHRAVAAVKTQQAEDQAADREITARHEATNAQVTRENAPAARQQIDFFGDIGAQAGNQLAANLRLARLLQLAQAKGCKGRG